MADDKHEQTGEPAEASEQEKHIEGSITLSDVPQVPAEPTSVSPGETDAVEEPESEPEPEPAPVAETNATPVRVDNRSRRDDNDALEGHFVKIIDGEHAGRVGTFDQVVDREDDGYPKTILVISRDEKNEILQVPYEDARPTSYKGGR